MKIGIYTTDIADYVSGGLLCVVSILNELHKQGYDVCAFVNSRPTSEWIPNEFPIYRSDSQEYKDFDGILISPFSPTAKSVANHRNAQEKLYHVNTNEGLFKYNGPEWTQQAIDSYSLPLKIFCTSRYVQTIMEQVYNRNVIGQLVPPGIDNNIFNLTGKERHWPNDDQTIRVVILGRMDWIRGVDIAVEGVRLASSSVPIEFKMIPGNVKSRVALAKYLQWADLYVDASRLAGSPTVPKEAMGCGVIPICTHYGFTDYVLDGYNGFVIGPDNPQEIADKIIRYHDLGEDRRSAMHQFAWDTAQNYTWKHIAQMFLKAIQEGQCRQDLLKNKGWQ